LSLIKKNGLTLPASVVSKIKFIESDFFDRFFKDVVDQTFKVSKKEVQLYLLRIIQENIDNKTLDDLMKYLADYQFSAKDDFQKIFVQKPIDTIEQKIETSKNKRKTNSSNAIVSGEELLLSTSDDLIQLQSIVGNSDLKFTSIADKLANEILQCSIDYFNYSQKKDINDD
jgi:hypothetical protein